MSIETRFWHVNHLGDNGQLPAVDEREVGFTVSPTDCAL